MFTIRILSRDVPEPDSELGSGKILHYPVTSGLPGFTTSGSAENLANTGYPDPPGFLGSIES